jgi:hypothetical protein
MLHSKQDILAAVRRHAERALSWDGEQLTIRDVYLPYESDLRMGECTVMVKWTRSGVNVATDDAIYTIQEDKGGALDVFGPEWPEYPPPWRLREVIYST